MEIIRVTEERFHDGLSVAIAKLEKGPHKYYETKGNLLRLITKYETFLFLDGNVPAAFVSLDPRSVYLGGSIRLHRICYDWHYNTEENITFFIRSAVRQIPGAEQRYICMDVQRVFDVNRPLYEKMGFRNSTMRSPVGTDFTVMVIQGSKL